jgi:hypothetical protein
MNVFDGLISRIRPRFFGESQEFNALRPLVFMHVPKTSGVSITRGLATTLAPTVAAGGFDYSLFGCSRDLSSLQEDLRRQIYTSPESMPKHANFVAGHISISTLTKAYPTAQRLTVLREPASRVLSHWLYWRQLTEPELAPWGDWADFVRLARKPLVNFLTEPTLASQTDNLILRMLLWPHPLIPATQFIDPVHDRHLLRDATARLAEFDFVDVVENDALADRLQCWLGRPFSYDRLNETRPIPQQFRSPLHRELTREAYDLLCVRSRLDLCLWAKIAAHRLPGRNAENLREQTILANVSRYSVLMDGITADTPIS